MIAKSLKMICLMAFAGLLTLGLSSVAKADAPAPGFYKSGKTYSKGINYPAYLYARGQRGEMEYRKLMKPAKGYDFRLVPLASHYFVSEW